MTYIRVCMYVCMYVCIYIYIYIHIQIQIHIHTHTHTYTYTCTHPYRGPGSLPSSVHARSSGSQAPSPSLRESPECHGALRVHCHIISYYKYHITSMLLCYIVLHVIVCAINSLYAVLFYRASEAAPPARPARTPKPGNIII